MNKKKDTIFTRFLDMLKLGLIGMAKDVWRVVGSFAMFLGSVAVMGGAFYGTGALVHFIFGFKISLACVGTGFGIWVVIFFNL